LLSDLSSYAITGLRINNVKHEFATIDGLREDILEIVLNLKEVILKSSFLSKAKTKKWKGFLNVQGPLIVTAGMFKLPKHVLTILNPEQYICTLVDSSSFYLEIDIEQGAGYQLIEERKKKREISRFRSGKPSTLLIDALFMPIRKVNYKIKLIHDTQGNIKESLCLEIWTNGSITPKRSLQESIKLLINLFYPLLVTPYFLQLSNFHSSSPQNKNIN
jgi:DNA-directed RNA polymerase subunit alpha